MFNLEQIDKDILFPLSKKISGAWKIIFTGWLLAYTTSPSFAQVPKVPTEHTYKDSSPNLVTEQSKVKKNAKKECVETDLPSVVAFSKRKKSWFLSKRFPFIVRRLVRTIGRLF